MNSIIENIYQTKKVIDGKSKSIDAFPTSIRFDEGMTLYQLIKKTKPKRTLEIGMGYGLSTLFICQAHCDNGNTERCHVVVDPYQRTGFGSIGLLNAQKAKLDKYLHFHERLSHDILPQLLNQKECFDFIFIDGSHLFDYVMLDLFYSDKLLPIGGYIMFDDLVMPAIQKVLSYILKNRQYALNFEFLWNDYPKLKRILRSLTAMRRFSFGRDNILFFQQNLCYGPRNYCIMKKTADDNREWQFHKSF